MLIGSKTIIRAINLDDLIFLLKYREDPEISYFLGNELPISMEMQKRWFEKIMSDNSKKKFIIETKDKKIIGMIGIMNIDMKNRHCECGITIGEKDCWGQGLASDALSVIIKFLFEEWDINRIYANVFEYNERSLKLFFSLGFQEDGRLKDYIFTHGRYYDSCLLSLKRVD